MNQLYLAFLRFSLWQMRFDLAIAQATGRNPASISTLRCDITRMETDLLRLEIRG